MTEDNHGHSTNKLLEHNCRRFQSARPLPSKAEIVKNWDQQTNSLNPHYKESDPQDENTYNNTSDTPIPHWKIHHQCEIVGHHIYRYLLTSLLVINKLQMDISRV